jgi:hypothetical protein
MFVSRPGMREFFDEPVERFMAGQERYVPRLRSLRIGGISPAFPFLEDFW